MRLTPKQRTRELLAHALAEAEHAGWATLTRAAVAARAGVSEALVSARLGTMQAVRRDVMRAAIRAGSLRVLAEGLAARDVHAMRAPEELKHRAAQFLCR